ncbi:MAG: hypothetical protein IH950_09480 [Bacteroidetes bacterium]|nr:hypothetical protein [Bacteroidota bacterium]
MLISFLIFTQIFYNKNHHKMNNSHRSKISRLPSRGYNDKETINQIIDEAPAKIRTGHHKDDDEDPNLNVWIGVPSLGLEFAPAQIRSKTENSYAFAALF